MSCLIYDLTTPKTSSTISKTNYVESSFRTKFSFSALSTIFNSLSPSIILLILHLPTRCFKKPNLLPKFLCVVKLVCSAFTNITTNIQNQNLVGKLYLVKVKLVKFFPFLI